MDKIFENWNRFVNEIEARGDVGSGRVDVNWAAGEADKVTDEKKPFQDMMVKVAPSGDHTKIIFYSEGDAIGYVSLVKFEDGHKVSTLSIKQEKERQGFSKKFYDYLISNHGPLYSGDSQTGAARGLWASLARRYKGRVVAVDVKTGQEYKTVEVDQKEKPQFKELAILDGDQKIYTYPPEKNNIYLRIK
tara:strand:- start:13637 stop:14206 length:570 start_codon:yes stop_codon:yes gene_type:complete